MNRHIITAKQCGKYLVVMTHDVRIVKVADRKISIIDVFFFQAEDGIRDCLLSRGLGEKYKRQNFPFL
nr:hypothetical protein [Clostridioides difficile]